MKIIKRCELSGCERTFELSSDAPHKRFCSQDHRIEHHNARRKKAEQALREQEASEGTQQSEPQS